MDDLAAKLADVNQRRPLARSKMIDALGTIPAAGSGTGAVSGVSDRTGRLACAYLANTSTDTARQDLDRLTDIEWTNKTKGGISRKQLEVLVDICDRWAPTERRRRALDTNLRAAADDLLNKHDDHGNCDSCKRVPGAWGEPHRQGLCKTCARHLDRVHALYDVTLELPPRVLVEVCKGKGKVTDHDIHAAMHGSRRRDA